MSNNRKRESVFHFKQFSVKNELSAMKIGIDGVLLGAWMDVASSSNILDIGAGSGVISLMAAQRCNATITAIEIDVSAAKEAKENIIASPWGNRINVVNADFLEWARCEATYNSYDHIVSNPPFFDNGILAPDSSRAMARHGNGLNYDSIISLAKKLLTESGRLSLISPVNRKNDILFSADISKMNVSRITEVCSTQESAPVRLLWELTIAPNTTIVDKLAIRKTDGNYSDEYISLTRDFYLKM